jgi:hypothetical protein
MMVTTGGRGFQRVFGSVLDVEQALLDVGFRYALDGVAEFLGDQLGRIGVDDVVDLDHLPLLHQVLDHIHGAFRHAVREFLDGDRSRAARPRARSSRARFSFSRRRRSEASERLRPSPSPVAEVIVSLDLRRSSPVRLGVRTGAGFARFTAFTVLRASASSSARCGRRLARGTGRLVHGRSRKIGGRSDRADGSGGIRSADLFLAFVGRRLGGALCGFFRAQLFFLGFTLGAFGGFRRTAGVFLGATALFLFGRRLRPRVLRSTLIVLSPGFFVSLISPSVLDHRIAYTAM